MATVSSLLIPAGYGWLAGMRSLSAPAAAGLWLRRNGRPRGGVARALTSPAARWALPAMAVAELTGDKWSRTPDRTALLPFAARLAAGALTGAAAAQALYGRRAATRGAFIGAAAALVSTLVSFRLRRAAGRALGSSARAGLAEDALTLGLGALLARA
jgi:uncharacterized membrane protein